MEKNRIRHHLCHCIRKCIVPFVDSSPHERAHRQMLERHLFTYRGRIHLSQCSSNCSALLCSRHSSLCLWYTTLTFLHIVGHAWAAQWLSQNMCVLWFYLYRKLNRECFTHIPKCSNAAMAIDTQNVFIEIVKCVLWHDHAYAQKCPINLEIVVDCGQCLLPGEWSSKTMKCLIHFDLFILFIHILLLLLLLFSASFRFSTFSVYCTWIELARRMHIV